MPTYISMTGALTGDDDDSETEDVLNKDVIATEPVLKPTAGNTSPTTISSSNGIDHNSPKKEGQTADTDHHSGRRRRTSTATTQQEEEDKEFAHREDASQVQKGGAVSTTYGTNTATNHDSASANKTDMATTATTPTSTTRQDTKAQEDATSFFLALAGPSKTTTPTAKSAKGDRKAQSRSKSPKRRSKSPRPGRPQKPTAPATLKFEDLDLHGRNKEGLQLQECLDRLLGDRQKQFVLVKGAAGTGKSALVTHALKPLTRNKHGGIFVAGKFDPYLRHVPYNGFVRLLQNLAPEIRNVCQTHKKHYDKNQFGFQEMREQMVKELGTTELVHDLLRVFPSLESIFFAERRKSRSGAAAMMTMSGSGKNLLGGGGNDYDDYDNNNDSDVPDNDHDDDDMSDITINSGAGGDHAPSFELLFGNVSTNAKNRFLFAVRTFFRILASYLLSPVVLVLADLQWADRSSLQLLESLMSDVDNKDLMVVCTLRTPPSSSSMNGDDGNGKKQNSNNYSNINHSVAKTIRDLSNTSNNNYNNGSSKDDKNKNAHGSASRHYYTEIEIDNLDVEAIHHIIQDLTTKEDTARTLRLAEICHGETQGNPSYFIRFISLLYDNHLLAYNTDSKKWVWDTKGIDRFFKSTGSMIDMFQNEMMAQCEDNRQALKYAAFLGSSFREPMLEVLWGTLYQVDGLSESTLDDVLKSCENHGFIELVGKETYSWCHNILQEAAVELVAPEERPILREEVADTLLEVMNENDVEDAMFTIANLYYDSTTPLEESKKLELAELNFRAAKKAATWSAYEIASIFCTRGASMLPTLPWGEDYALCRSMYTLAAEVEAFLGNTDRMATCCELVLRNTQRPIEDKFRAYTVLMENLSQRNMPGDAVDICLSVLDLHYDCKFPKGSAVITLRNFSNHMRIKSTLKSRSAQEVKRLPLMKNQNQIEQMALFDKLAACCYQSGNDILPLVVFKSLRWTLKYGVCDFSPVAFAMAGMILAGSDGDLAGGAIYGKYALLLLVKLKTHAIECRTMFLVYAFALHWTAPSKTMLKPLLQSYQSGLRAGDTENAMLAVYHYVVLAFVSGNSLYSIERDCRMYTMQMKALKEKPALDQCLLIWQLVLNLMGHSKDVRTLTGEAMVETEYKKAASQERGRLLSVLQVHQMILLSVLGDYDICVAMALESGDTLKERLPGSPLVVQDTFHRALAFLVRAQKTKKKTYAKEGKKLVDRIKHWVDQGNPNVKHYEALLEAEVAHNHGRVNVAKTQYEASINLASAGGFVQDAAIATERYGVFLLETVGDKLGATRRLKEACKRFRGWGAFAKADALEVKYGGLFPREQNVAFTT